ncbi:MAG: hypothetical protein HXX08_03895 [Chloroflexi bacterium]|uniref:Uncharacterized protein n=1 Tax=Candidatus Chlorohelix allophototropha TaxID=3003348 RepID=A0A8T7M0Q1_9CHLR|nr:hypothetical protein [Chloroflexota bacterium]WJW66882.1 hypothetical protein OZ401_000127 [Chloroflexota bacterium L227-S17]
MTTVETCPNCKKPFNQDSTSSHAPILVCSNCGASLFKQSITANIISKPKIVLKAKNGGKGKPFIEIIVGYDWSQALKRFVNKYRLVDRHSNKYKEVISDGETDNVIHFCEEPLNEHQDRGTAKLKKSPD